MIARSHDATRDAPSGQFLNPKPLGSKPREDRTFVQYGGSGFAFSSALSLLLDGVIESKSMRIHIYSNEIESHLTNFIGKFLANVCVAVAASLKTPQPIRTVSYEIEGDTVRIQVNEIPVPLDMSRGFSRIIVHDTLRGMICHLKLADPNGTIRIEVDMEIET